jgi:hypothetical protein
MDFAEGVYLSDAQNAISPPYTVHCTFIQFNHTGKGGGGEELNQREG